jgi:hypothetical protein
MRRNGFTATHRPWKCATQDSITRHSASSAGRRGVGAVEHVQVHLDQRPLRFHYQLADAAVAATRGVHGHGFEVREQHVPVLKRRLLLPPEQLGGAQAQRVVAAVEEVPEDHVRELLEEQRRHVDRPLEQAHVAALDRARGEQPVAEAQQQAVVVARVLVPQALDLRRRDRAARLLHQRGVQAPLGVARLLYRMDLGPQVIRAQEIVGDGQPPSRVPAQQVETAVTPEIRQVRRRAANAPPRAAAGTPSGRRGCGGW